jgi:uncharacterized membrane protein
MYFLPLVLIILSNIAYNVTQKNTPENANPFGALLLTYLVSIAITVVCMFAFKSQWELTYFKNTNWTSYALGFALVGLEAGYLFLYRAGWNISIGSLVANIVLAIALIIIGVFFYKEQLTTSKLVGIVLCVAGLYFINK